jgi:hypothetical protein
MILATVGRFDMDKLGKQIMDAPLNSWWLVRGDMKPGFRKIYIKALKRLDK